MKKAYKAGDAVKGEFYNRRQHAYKIKLNDLYGCYAINGWRYTDGHKVISKAITLTGQRVTQESIKFINCPSTYNYLWYYTTFRHPSPPPTLVCYFIILC